MVDVYIVRKGKDWPEEHCGSAAGAASLLAVRTAEDPGKWEGATIVACDAWWAGREDAYVGRAAVAIDAGRFDELLDVLPPAHWNHVDGIERFIVPEAVVGGVYLQVARLGDRHVTKYVRARDRSTHVTAADFADAVPPTVAEAA